jgi:hypothetical protein
MTGKYAAITNVMRQEDPEQSLKTAPSPRPLSKPEMSKIT